MNNYLKRCGLATAVAGICLSTAVVTHASSHREAPFITKSPKVDGTDFYMFRSYESGREDFVTLIANYQPFQAPFGGPEYFDLDENAIYEIHIDNSGNAEEDITFQFNFQDIENDLTLPIGPNGDDVAVPIKNIGSIGPEPGDTDDVQARQSYTLNVIEGDRRTGSSQSAMNLDPQGTTFLKPVDNIGEKSFDQAGGYEAYAENHIYDVDLGVCSENGRVFVGQRQEAFAIGLGEIFDLVNLDAPTGDRGTKGFGDLVDMNVTTIALEVPIDCVAGSAMTEGGEPVVGAWSTASVRQARVINPTPTADSAGASVEGGAFTQVSRLGMPLVNEVVIGRRDKDLFNHSHPRDDAANFLTYVTHPTLPVLLNTLFNLEVPDTPRTVDLVPIFLTGAGIVGTAVENGWNADPNAGPVTAAELLRLNLATAVTEPAMQNDLGVLGGDAAGFPNGRRPIDDVVDASLRVAAGTLVLEGDNAADELTDQRQVDETRLINEFPYLGTPIQGSPSDRGQ